MRNWAAFVGTGLAGYGALIVLRVLPHDAPLAGWAALGLGMALLVVGLLNGSSAPGQERAPGSRRRAHAVTAVGAIAIVGVVAFEAVRGNGLERPEWGILAYGAGLLVAAPHLGRPVGRWTVGDAVAWSFPLLLAPLAMYALNAVLSGDGSTAAMPVVHVLLVVPTGTVLGWLGTPVDITGNQLVMATPRGSLVLGIGLVCAGLYPMVLFGGLVALHGWREGHGPKRLAAYLGAGLVGLWVVNLARLAMLAKVGQASGAGALQTAHAHLGWVLFGLFMLVFWAVVLRYVERPARPLETA